jgi:hypothetical protein
MEKPGNYPAFLFVVKSLIFCHFLPIFCSFLAQNGQFLKFFGKLSCFYGNGFHTLAARFKNIQII